MECWLTEKKSNLFDMRLRYHDPQKPGTKASYTGNITEWEWQYKGRNEVDSTLYTYGFDYDKLSRLTDSRLFKNTNTSPENKYTERGITYDKNGNILSFIKTDYNADDYSADYDGNRLMSLNGSDRLYEYDSNGNRTFDGNSGMKIYYNYLNLTGKVYSENAYNEEPYDTAFSTFRWLADGTKAGYSLFGDSASFEYLGSLKYVCINGEITLTDTPFGGGRIIVSEGASGMNYTPYYHITDHLGSTRAIVADNVVKEVVNYYPYGERWGSWGFRDGSNMHYFNGKEAILGANDILDYGARMYEAPIGRWWTMDPLAEKYFSFSPYTYCLNNPVRYIDPNGQDVWEMDYRGNVVWKQKSDDHIMYALNQDGTRTGQSITVTDRNILDQLATGRDKKDYNGNYAITDSYEASDVFLFAANNTEVEWSLQGYKGDASNQYVLKTSHSAVDVDNLKIGEYGLNMSNQTFDIHSHPGPNGTKGASGDLRTTYMGDMAYVTAHHYQSQKQNVPLPPHYVYHKESRTLYNYTPWESSIYIKQVTNNQGLRFLAPKKR